MVNMLRSIGEVFRPKRAVEAKETNKAIKKEVSDVKFATETATNVSDVIEYLLKLHSYKNKNEFKKHVDRTYLASLKDKFVLLKSKLDDAEKANPSVKDLAIVRFCRSIAENNELHKELSNLARKCHNDGIHKKLNVLKKYRNVPHATSYERLYPQLDKLVTNFDMHQLQKQISFLKKLKEKSDFNAIRNDYSNAWDFDDLLRDLMRDEKFRREYITKALDEEGESFSKSFKEDLNKYIELANESVKAARKCLGEEVGLQTYYTQINDTDRALNINIIGRNKTEPTKISDLLQKEENTSELNIYYKKKHEVRAYRDEKKRRYYEFKGGASYEMTNTWRAEDESGNTSICKMVMNVSSNGITEIVEFNGKKSGLLSKDDLKLVQQNDALYIQGLSFYDGVEKWLSSQCGESLRVIEKDKEKDTVTMPVVAGNSLQEDKAIEVKQNPNDKSTDTSQDFESSTIAAEVKQNPNDKGIDANQDFESSTIAAEVKQNPNDKGIDANLDFESSTIAAEVKQNPNDKGIDANLDFESSTIAVVCDTPASEVTKTSKIEIGTQTEVNTRQIAIQTEVGSLQMDELANSKQEVSKLKKENVELKQAVGAGLQAMNKKCHELMQEKQLLLEELKTTKVEKEELSQKLLKIIELDERIKHVNELLKDKVEELCGEKCDLQDEIKKIKQEFERQKGFMNQRIADAQQKVVELSRRDSDLRCEIAEARQIIERLEQQNSDLQVRGKSENQVVESLKEQNGNLQIENSDLKGDLIDTKQKIKKLEQENGDLRAKDREIIEKLEEQNSILKAKNDKACEELAKLKKEQKESTKELEDVYEKKEKVEKKLVVLSQENITLKSRLEKSEEDLKKTENYAEYLMDEGSKAERGFRSKMLELEQNYKEQLKSSSKSVEEQEWKFKELQNELELRLKELQSKKKKFEEAGKVYGELEAELESEKIKNSMREGILQGMVKIRKDLENEIEKLQKIVEGLEDTITGQERRNEDLTKQNEDLTKEVESLKECIERFIKDNTTDADKIKHLVSNNPEFYTLVRALSDVGDIILPNSLSRSTSTSSVDSGCGSDNRPWVERVKPSSNVAAVKS